jgi:hypothetical protein
MVFLGIIRRSHGNWGRRYLRGLGGAAAAKPLVWWREPGLGNTRANTYAFSDVLEAKRLRADDLSVSALECNLIAGGLRVVLLRRMIACSSSS